MSLWILISIVATSALIVSLMATQIYNRLVTLATACDNGFSQIEIQLKRRYDLVPNLVECVRGYLAHERETLEAVTAARNHAAAGLIQAMRQPRDAGIFEQWMGAEDALAGALSRLTLVMETYPELQGDESVAELTEELTSTENRIAFARQSYNDWVTHFNTYRQTFPACAFSGTLGFTENRKFVQFANPEQLNEAPKIGPLATRAVESPAASAMASV
jgi:LemA protein